VRCRDVDVAHSDMKPLKRMRIVGGRDLVRGVVVCPERDGEAIAPVDERRDPGLKGHHRSVSSDELPGELNLECCSDVEAGGCDSSEYITRKKAQREPGRVLNDVTSSTGRLRAVAAEVTAATARATSSGSTSSRPIER